MGASHVFILESFQHQLEILGTFHNFGYVFHLYIAIFFEDFRDTSR
jgi:hypothetical protein